MSPRGNCTYTIRLQYWNDFGGYYFL
jgi:hypothetical protein